ncbi:PVC-type heme-binding CxxCH protein [Dyadobacter fanqingshengii]|uniref:ThuA domain-containing protein n=1 Tax=Dyadobacter fanqingshengii TaxID=2906443 RepID=A0A9X1P6W9_9BACT|nr:PVC-type heme-binding CxxCH protein [Dyadobacter fanqingshengii]MCF0038804.1 ThuA domain-containing protein [Dyadobacter fanqingshengii]USJ34368.1 ThuA domain-containing protein [Dyadobacter fanqingshengii]
MKTKALSFILGIVLLGCASQPSSQNASVKSSSAKSEAGKARRLEILFLGDNGHHKPAERVPQIMAALGPKGFNFTYTDNLNDLNPETLNKYDALMLYANWDSIAPQQAKALLDYVASGKGFIPIHCASYCFRNNPDVVKLMGGQFWRHTWDTIQPVWTKPDHPAIAGVKEFKTVDETYLHEKLQPDNIVLTERLIQKDQEKDRPGQQKEPYTWVRTHGKGRIFYTAYGHDERTWSVPGFQDMIEKGILWAVNDDARKSLAALAPKPFEYRAAKLPNYEQRPGAQMQQLPLSPEESVKHIQIPVDFTLDVFAHEPDVMHPIAMTWDERGRLFVLITKDYPNERKDTGGSDYILICEDTNKDGKADKFTKFSDDLSIPTGLVFANGGIIVSQAPHMLFLQDTNGDDKADVKKILFSGFGTGDTHAGPSNLHYGFDNWVYGSVGYSGFKGKFGSADSLNFGQALFRFKPDGTDMEIVAKTSNNTWGLGFNEAGDLFGSTANNSHGWYSAIPNRYFGKSKVDNGSRSTDTHKDMQPITPKVRQVDVFGGFTAAAGHNFYTARAFPKQYWNKVAFVSEPTGHILHQNVMNQKGTDFEDGLGFNLLAGADEWVAPVFAEVGPDGAVWVADWYSYIIQHNPTPKGSENGKGNAYQTDLRDFTHGRLYRIGWKNAPKYTPIVLSKDRPDELVATLKNTNMLWRRHAQRLLVERGQKDVAAKLVELVKDKSVDEVGLNTAAIHALWTLHGLKAIEDPQVLAAVTEALKHPSADVRKTAVQVLPRNPATAQTLLTADALHDKAPLVVLNSLLAFSEIPYTPEVETAVLGLMDTYAQPEDRWMPDAFAAVLNAQDGKLREKYLAQRVSKSSATAAATQKADAAKSMDHSNMDHSAHAAAAKPTVEGSAELAITNITIEPKTPYVREYARVVIEITNQGTVAVPKELVPVVNVGIRSRSLNTNYISRQLNNGIAPGETVKLIEGNNGPWKSGFGFTSDESGKVNITATVDVDNVVPEKDENKNNTMSKSFEVKRMDKLSDFALERATRGYTSYATGDDVLKLMKTAQTLDPQGRNAIFKGIVGAWNPKRKETANDEGKTLLASVKGDLPEDLSARFTTLMESYGIKEDVAVDPNVQVVQIKAIREEMKFSLTEFTAIAGKTIELVFENPDAMQHNVVVGKPKSTEIIGAAADKMITAKDGAEKNYVPNIPQVLAATPLVNPGQTFRLKFVVPDVVGDYPYVCTFPGHWRLMKGNMKVIKEQAVLSK